MNLDAMNLDSLPDAAGGGGGHGVANPNRVIHRYLFYNQYPVEIDY
jgi:hypothetical protein